MELPSNMQAAVADAQASRKRRLLVTEDAFTKAAPAADDDMAALGAVSLPGFRVPNAIVSNRLADPEGLLRDPNAGQGTSPPHSWPMHRAGICCLVCLLEFRGVISWGKFPPCVYGCSVTQVRFDAGQYLLQGSQSARALYNAARICVPCSVFDLFCCRATLAGNDSVMHL